MAQRCDILMLTIARRATASNPTFSKILPAEGAIAANTKTLAARLELLLGDTEEVVYALSNVPAISNCCTE